MTKTTNYQLNQWAKSDRVMMDDFNADNTKIDAALKANADTAAANTQTLAAQAQTIASLATARSSRAATPATAPTALTMRSR